MKRNNLTLIISLVGIILIFILAVLIRDNVIIKRMEANKMEAQRIAQDQEERFEKMQHRLLLTEADLVVTRKAVDSLKITYIKDSLRWRSELWMREKSISSYREAYDSARKKLQESKQTKADSVRLRFYDLSPVLRDSTKPD